MATQASIEFGITVAMRSPLELACERGDAFAYSE